MRTTAWSWYKGIQFIFHAYVGIDIIHGYYYNEDRKYLENSWLLTEVGIMLRRHIDANNNEPDGGRIFLNSYEVLRKVDNRKIICLSNWEGEDPIKKYNYMVRLMRGN